MSKAKKEKKMIFVVGLLMVLGFIALVIWAVFAHRAEERWDKK